jgi:flagellar hook assembly protein FlgD
MYKWKYQFSIDNNTAAVSTDKAIAITKNGATDLSAYPNPVIGNANISFSLTQAQKVSVNIYDLNGRLVKAIANENMEAGPHQLTWNAKDNNGNTALEGIYFISVETLQSIQTKKIIVTR